MKASRSAPCTCQRTTHVLVVSSHMRTATAGSTHFTPSWKMAWPVFWRNMSLRIKVCFWSSTLGLYHIRIYIYIRVCVCERECVSSITLPSYCTLSAVKLNPPANLTVKLGPDSNLWYYWNQTSIICAEHEVRYRINNREWDVSNTKGNFTNSNPFLLLLFSLSSHLLSPFCTLSLLLTGFQSCSWEFLHQPALHKLPVWTAGPE